MNVFRMALYCLGSAIAASALFAFAPSNAPAQVAGRPITIIVPYTPGTGIDILARALGGELARHWGQPVVVDNRQIGRAHVGTPVTAAARMPSSARKNKHQTKTRS